MITLFLVCGVIGLLLYVLQTIAQFVGGDVDHDISSIHVDDGSGADSHHSDSSFKWLSFKAITSFLSMFGFVGFAMIKRNHMSGFVAFIGATIAGVITVYVLNWVIGLMKKAQSSGTLDYKNAIGKCGSMYLSVQSGQGETGTVTIGIQNQLVNVTCISKNNNFIKTGETVLVTGVTDDNKLIVEKK